MFYLNGRCIHGEHTEGSGHLYLDAERANWILLYSARAGVDAAHEGTV